MTQRLRRSLGRIVGLVVVLWVAGCAPKPVVPLRVGMSVWPPLEFFHLAQEKGFNREAGIAVRIVQFSTVADCRRAFERGQIDVMGASLVEVLQIRDQSPRSPQVIQVLDYSAGADLILVRPDFAGGVGLRGARIGVEVASLGAYVLARGLEKYGLGLADVRPSSMDPESMEAAFRNGELDAVVMYPPASTKLLRDFKAKVLFSTAEIPGEVVGLIAVEAEVAVTRAADVGRLMQAFRRAQAYAAQNPADAHAIMGAREGLTAQEFAAALGDTGIRLVSAVEQADYLGAGGKLGPVIERTDRFLRQGGQLRGPDRRVGIVNAGFIVPNNSQ